jgi:hypothetical protein
METCVNIAVCGPVGDRVGDGPCFFVAGRTQLLLPEGSLDDTRAIYCQTLETIRAFFASGDVVSALPFEVAAVTSTIAGSLIPAFCNAMDRISDLTSPSAESTNATTTTTITVDEAPTNVTLGTTTDSPIKDDKKSMGNATAPTAKTTTVAAPAVKTGKDTGGGISTVVAAPQTAPATSSVVAAPMAAKSNKGAATPVAPTKASPTAQKSNKGATSPVAAPKAAATVVAAPTAPKSNKGAAASAPVAPAPQAPPKAAASAVTAPTSEKASKQAVAAPAAAAIVAAKPPSSEKPSKDTDTNDTKDTKSVGAAAAAPQSAPVAKSAKESAPMAPPPMTTATAQDVTTAAVVESPLDSDSAAAATAANASMSVGVTVGLVAAAATLLVLVAMAVYQKVFASTSRLRNLDSRSSSESMEYRNRNISPRAGHDGEDENSYDGLMFSTSSLTDLAPTNTMLSP